MVFGKAGLTRLDGLGRRLDGLDGLGSFCRHIGLRHSGRIISPTHNNNICVYKCFLHHDPPQRGDTGFVKIVAELFWGKKSFCCARVFFCS